MKLDIGYTWIHMDTSYDAGWPILPHSLAENPCTQYIYMVVSHAVVTESAAMLGPRAGATSLHRGQFRCIVCL